MNIIICTSKSPCKYSNTNQKHAEVRSACWEKFVKSIFKPNIFHKSHNDKSGDFRVGRIVMLIKSDDGGKQETILNNDLTEGVYSILYLRFLECQPKSYDVVDQQKSPNVQCSTRIQAVKVANIYLFSILIIFKHCITIVVLSLSFLEKEFPLKTQPWLLCVNELWLGSTIELSHSSSLVAQPV